MNKTVHFSIIIILLILSLIFFYTLFINDTSNNTIKHNNATVTILLDNEPSITFHCELAVSAQQKHHGLMNRTYLAHNQGMLFIIDPPRNVTFWMKNTLIALDIIFIDETNKIIQIESAPVEHNTSDINLTRYHSILPVSYVLEINYGLSKLYNITQNRSCIIEYK